MSDVEAITGPLRGPLRKKESNLWEREKHDHYVEPPWASARLFIEERFEGNVVDPSCGFGNIVRSAIDAGLDARGYDIVKRSEYCLAERDFMRRGYVELALERAERKVAMLLPANWVQGDKRSRWLATTPLRRVLFIAPRPSMPNIITNPPFGLCDSNKEQPDQPRIIGGPAAGPPAGGDDMPRQCFCSG